MIETVINKTIYKKDDEFYFTPLGIYWKPYILENKSQVEILKAFLKKLFKIVFVLIILVLLAFESKWTFPIYLLVLICSFILTIYKVKRIQKIKT